MKNRCWITKIVIGALLTLIICAPLPAWAQGAVGSPANGSTVSGIGLIRGYECTPPTSGLINLVIDGNIQFDAAYGTAREDTAEICDGQTDSGWGATFNYNLLGEGEHTLTAFSDGEEIGSTEFTVGRPSDEEFLRGAPLTYYILPDFPDVDSATVLQWQEAEQNFMVVESSSGVVPEAGTWSNSEEGSFDVCWNVSSNGGFLTSVGSDCEDGAALRLEGTGLTDNGLECSYILVSTIEIPITFGLFILTVIDTIGIDGISNIVGKFTDTTNAIGRSVASSVTVDSCRVEFTNSLSQ